MTDKIQTKKWVTYPKINTTAEEELSEYPAFFRQLLFNRGITTAAEAQAFLSADIELADPFLLIGLEKAVVRLLEAVRAEELIVIYGDYDVDGVTATALMVEVLHSIGGRVEPYIPNRFDEGYGLNEDAVVMLATQRGAKVILTVDCGIRSPHEAQVAKSLGVDLIISDHHFPQGELPDGYAVICPKQEGDAYPYKDLAGVGVAYKISQGIFILNGMDVRKADEWLDLVALGTVADMLPLTGENRSMVKKGLVRIQSGSRTGLTALAGAAGKNIRKTSSSDIGYILGPRLNAAGRMESAQQAYQLLVSTSVEEAGRSAQVLDNHNTERQKATRLAQEKAQLSIADPAELKLITSFDAEYSSGIVGLVASKLVEKFYRPAIVGEILEDTIRASCRSIPGFHITKALDECSDLLVRHGGHEMAAGFTVRLEMVDALTARLQQIAARELADKDLRQRINADLEWDLASIRPKDYEWLEKLQPTGMSNASPLFISRGNKLEQLRVMGKEGTHLQFSVHGCAIGRAVAFNQGHWYQTWFEEKPRFDLVYSIEVNQFMGTETLQLNIRDMKISAIGF